jgi:hypothetical protein
MDGRESIGDGRVSIPLQMLEGNLDVLLNNEIPVNFISLKRYEDAGVVLVVSMDAEQKEAARALGFRTTSVGADE